jgi:hypothetical protein
MVFNYPADDIAIDLFPEGDSTSYHSKPSFRDGFESQRGYITEHRADIQVQAKLVLALHGTLSPDGDPASLIVTDFYFDAPKNRQFKSIQISYKFKGGNPSNSGPELVEISPKGYTSIIRPTRKFEALKLPERHSAQASEVRGWAWERVSAVESSGEERTVLAGTMRLEGRDFGGKDTARWMIQGSGVEQSGIPTFLRTAIRLKRDPDNARKPFHATIEITADAGSVSRMMLDRVDRLFGRTELGEPIEFDPSEEDTKDVLEINRDNLGSIKLEDLSVVMTTERVEWGYEDDEAGLR